MAAEGERLSFGHMGPFAISVTEAMGFPPHGHVAGLGSQCRPRHPARRPILLVLYNLLDFDTGASTQGREDLPLVLLVEPHVDVALP